jgi:hypothetical protein
MVWFAKHFFDAALGIKLAIGNHFYVPRVAQYIKGVLGIPSLTKN